MLKKYFKLIKKSWCKFRIRIVVQVKNNSSFKVKVFTQLKIARNGSALMLKICKVSKFFIENISIMELDFILPWGMEMCIKCTRSENLYISLEKNLRRCQNLPIGYACERLLQRFMFDSLSTESHRVPSKLFCCLHFFLPQVVSIKKDILFIVTVLKLE